MLNKRMQKLIATGTALLITLTVMIGAAWAILSTSKVGLTVNVSYDPLVTAKVYLATNSSTAGEFYQDSPTVDGAGETTAFNTANSALVLNTKDTTPLTKNLFEQLGSGSSNGLKCDANGEMEFYVYVENYSTTESVYYRANIEFVGTGEKIAPFSTVTNPSYETAITATELGNFSKSLLTFKIKSTNTTGLNANAIQIEIELNTSFPAILGMRLYDDSNTAGDTVRQNYKGLYYLDFGEYQQVAIRWLIIGCGNNLNDVGFPNKNGNNGADLSSNQLLLLSEKVIEYNIYNTSDADGVLWVNTSLYAYIKNNLINTIFNDNEKELLNTFDDNTSKLSILSCVPQYKYSNYCFAEDDSNLILISNSNYYWLRTSSTFYKSPYHGHAQVINCNGGLSMAEAHNFFGIRPIIILNLI